MGRLTVDLTGQSVKPPEEVRGQEPTHISRYWILAQILHSLGASNKKLLDVGGKEGLLREFGYKPTVLDMEASKEPNFVHGNALDMPFKDGSFDISVSCDVLEHIAEDDRKQFIAEMLRVSKVAIICAPFDNPGVSEAEKEINAYHKKLFGKDHRWLKEHIDNGLPSEPKTDEIIKKIGGQYVKFHHFSLDIWPLVLKTHLLHAAYGDSKPVSRAAAKVYQDYYDLLCAYDFSSRGYRTFYIVSHSQLGIKLPDDKKVQDKKRRFENNLLDALAETVRGQAVMLQKTSGKTARLQQSVNRLTAEKRSLSQELGRIKSSRSWKMAQAISKARNLGKK